MRLSLRRARTPIGLDIGSRSIKAVQLERRGGGWRVLAAVAFSNSEPELSGPGVKRITQVLERQGFAGRSYVLAIPAAKLLVDLLELPPRSSGAPIEMLAAGELARSARIDGGQIESGVWDLPAPARATGSTLVMAAGVRRDDANALLDAFEENDLRVLALDAAPCAMERACESRVGGGEGLWGILDIGWSASRLVLVHQAAIVYQRTFTEFCLGAAQRSIGQRLALEDALAGHILDGAVGGTGRGAQPAEVRDAVTEVLSRLADSAVEELQASFAYAGHRYPAAAVEGVLAIGGGASLGGLTGRLSERLGVAVTPMHLDAVAECPGHIRAQCRLAPMAIALGLAMHPGE